MSANTDGLHPDSRVPKYLGRVLADGIAVGTCFQVVPNILITAWHVLDDIQADIGSHIAIDALAGGVEEFSAVVEAVHPVHDIAILRAESELAESVKGWAATDALNLGTSVTATGVSRVDDGGFTYSHIDAEGRWAGGTTRDQQVALGRFSSKDLVRGMSGAPVRRASDDYVVGVISARYNSSDGWLRDSVFTARVEDVAALLEKIAPIEVDRPAAHSGSLELTLAVSESNVRLHGIAIDVSEQHSGFTARLADAVSLVAQQRALANARSSHPDAPSTRSEPEWLRRVGELAAESFLPPRVAAALAAEIERATRSHVSLRLGIEVGPYVDVPWEAVPDPTTKLPLALHPLVTIFRKTPTIGSRSIPGPLKILVAIADPEGSREALIDYERELRNVLSAVRAARQGSADVRVLEFASAEAIRQALEDQPAHVLHLTSAGSRSHVVLEDDRGGARAIGASDFMAEAIPAGRVPTAISLATRYFEPSIDGTIFADDLVSHGVSVVIAAEASVSDRYSTAVFARVYQEVARSSFPDVVAALSTARRVVQRQLVSAENSVDRLVATYDEWSAVTVRASTSSVPLFDEISRSSGTPRHRMPMPGLPTMRVGDFVGRRREKRSILGALTGGAYAGVAVHGLGGIGKTAFAGELLNADPDRAFVALSGELNCDTILARIASALRDALASESGQVDSVSARAVNAASDLGSPWQERFDELSRHFFAEVPLLVLFDNFDDNLSESGTVKDADLANLLVRWLESPGETRIITTSRRTFTLPENAYLRMLSVSLGPLSRAETFKLVWSLPALDRLDEEQVNRAWRLVGGHPRSLEYLDALLNNKVGRYHEVTSRLAAAIEANDDARAILVQEDFDDALAATATLIADDLLLGQLHGSLSADGRRLLVLCSVHRIPVVVPALGSFGGFSVDLWDRRKPRLVSGTDDPLSNATRELMSRGLVEFDEVECSIFVLPSTASGLRSMYLRDGLGDRIEDAHRVGSLYWQFIALVAPDTRARIGDLLECRYHAVASRNVVTKLDVTKQLCDLLRTIGAWNHAAELAWESIDDLAPNSVARGPWYSTLGRYAQQRGGYVEAKLLHEMSLSINNRTTKPIEAAKDLANLGYVAQKQGRYAEAESLNTQAFEVFWRARMAASCAVMNLQMGRLAHLRCGFDIAAEWYDRALRQLQVITDSTPLKTQVRAAAHLELSRLATDQDDGQTAGDHLTEALKDFEAVDDPHGKARCLLQTGVLDVKWNSGVKALEFYRMALSHSRWLGDEAGIALCHAHLGEHALSSGNGVEAKYQLEAARVLFEEQGDRRNSVEVWDGLARLSVADLDWPEAVRWGAKVLQTSLELGLPDADIVQPLLTIRENIGRVQFTSYAAEVVPLSELIRVLDFLNYHEVLWLFAGQPASLDTVRP